MAMLVISRGYLPWPRCLQAFWLIRFCLNIACPNMANGYAHHFPTSWHNLPFSGNEVFRYISRCFPYEQSSKAFLSVLLIVSREQAVETGAALHADSVDWSLCHSMMLVNRSYHNGSLSPCNHQATGLTRTLQKNIFSWVYTVYTH